MRMAVARVSGLSTGRPRTRGAAPAAWKPSILGSPLAFPRAWYSLYPIQWAVMFPALPTGRAW